MQHKETLIEEDTALKRLMAWQSFALYGLWLILLGYIGTQAWSAYTVTMWLEAPVVWASWGIERMAIILSLCVLIGLVKTTVKILTRFRLEQNLRFDVHAAVCEVVSQALARHLPDYQKLTTVVAVGEELLKPAEIMSRRAARIQLALQQQLPGLGLAEAINLIVRDALRSADIADSVTNVETILTRIDNGGTGDNVVQLEQRPSA